MFLTRQHAQPLHQALCRCRLFSSSLTYRVRRPLPLVLAQFAIPSQLRRFSSEAKQSQNASIPECLREMNRYGFGGPGRPRFRNRPVVELIPPKRPFSVVEAEATYADTGRKQQHLQPWTVRKLQALLGGDEQPLSRLVPFLMPADKAARRRVRLAVAALLCGKAATICSPLLLAKAINTLAAGGAATNPILAYSLVGGYATGRILAAVFAELRSALFSRVSVDASRSLSMQTFRQLHRMDLDWLLVSKSGELSSVLARGQRSATSLLNMLVFQMVPTALEFALVLGVLAGRLGGGAAGVTALTMAIYVAYTTHVTRRRTQLRWLRNEAEQQVNGVLHDSLINAEAVRLFTNEGFELDRYRILHDRLAETSNDVQVSLSALNAGQQIIFHTGVLASCLMTVSQILAGAAPVGSVALVTALLAQLAMPLNMIGTVYRETKLNLLDLQRLHHLLLMEPRCVSPPGAPAFEFRGGRIQFKNVHFAYRPDRELLELTRLDSNPAASHDGPPSKKRHVEIFNGLDLTVEPGQVLGIVGPSGIGKSTICKLLYRFYDPDQGSVLVDGQDLRTVDLASYRDHLGMVPQDVVLFNSTLRYNLLYGNPGASEAQLHAAIEAAQLQETIDDRCAEGLNTTVGERGLKLSGGEKQRVGIARCFLRNPSIVILDEATSSLDSTTEHAVVKALKNLAKGRTAIVIAHRLGTVAKADLIAVLGPDGTVVETGTPQELLADPDSRFARMWKQQMRGASGDSSSSSSSSSDSENSVGGND